MKFFIFGNGKWSKNHQRILKTNCIPFEVFDIDTTPFDACLKHGAPMAVIVTASTVNHHTITKHFLENDIPVFCEKPICLETWQLDNLETFIPNRPIFMAGHQLVFDKIIHGFAKEGSAVFFSSKRTGAIPRCEGAIMSLAVHDIAIAMHLFNYEKPISIEVAGNQHTAQLMIHWENKTADIYVQSIAQVQLRHATIVGNTGKCTSITPDCWNRTDLLEKELMHFVECVATGKYPTRNNLQQAIEVMRVTIAARDKINSLQQKG